MRFTPFGFLGGSGLLVDYLIVGGGGSGGNALFSGGGGGGAGGLLSGSRLLDSPQTYTVTVGAGGVYVSGNASGSNGEDSSIFGFTAFGGGGGGGYKPIETEPGVFTATPFGPGIGGSGGGGACNYQNITPKYTEGAIGTDGQGYAGGRGSTWNSDYGGGGGGGASQVGTAVVVNESGFVTTPGNGGSGSVWLDGNFYAGGGGGSGGEANADAAINGGVGGIGGGGDGADGGRYGRPSSGGNGTPNTGGGGGGAFGYTSTPGGTGGSGVVIIRYPGSVPLATGGVITSGSGYVYHKFTASADFDFTNQQTI